MATVRTNIEIDDEVLRAAMRVFGVTTKREAVHLALVRAATRPMSRDELLAQRGARHLRDDWDPEASA